MQQRGIIMAPPIKVTDNGFTSGIDLEQHIRMVLFFWDKVVLPNNNAYHIDYSYVDDVVSLQSAGILEIQEIFSWGGLINKDFFLGIQEQVFQSCNDEKSEFLWSLQQLHEGLSFQSSNHQSSNLERTIEFELYNAIPIPQRDTPLADILEFKEKHRDELIALRSCLDDMYLEIIKSPDKIFAKNAKLLRLSKAIDDLHKSMKSKSLKKSLTSQKIILRPDASDLVGGIAAAYGLYEVMNKFGITEEFSAILAGLGAFFKIGLKDNPITKGIPSELKDYAYISKIAKEFI